MEKLTFIDLFSGCGGFTEGLMQSGKFEGLAHLEWEIPMVETLRKRLKTKWHHSEEDSFKNVIHFDIQKIDELFHGNWSIEGNSKYINSNHQSIIEKGLIGLINGRKVDVIIGGPPCQAYSIAGRAQDKNSMKDDYRNYLFESFTKVVQKFQPEVFVFENVPGILSAKPGGKLATERIYEAFKSIGYSIRKPDLLKKSIYSASELGVPQKRKRVIIIGVRDSSNINLEKFYSELDLTKQNSPILNVKDAIGHLPNLEPLKVSKKMNRKNISHEQIDEDHIKFHVARYHNGRDIEIFKKWLLEDMNKKSSHEKISFYNNILGKKANHAKYRNLEWNKPSPTVVAHLQKDGLMFIHPDINQARSITVKEAAILQSFPDDFEFIGSNGFAYKMIGNAVPPIMAKNIATSLFKTFKNK